MALDFEKLEQDVSDIFGGSPSGNTVGAPDFWTKPLEYRQKVALRGAQTEVARKDRLLRAELGQDLYEDEMAGGFFGRMGTALSTASQPLFDMMSIANYTGAGAVEEYITTGSAYDAFKRGAAEFINALPVLDEDDALMLTGKAPKRASYNDVIKRMQEEYGFKFHDDATYNKYLTAGTGFVLDVLLDPLTYFGGIGLAKSGGLKLYGLSDMGAGVARRLGMDVAQDAPEDTMQAFARSVGEGGGGLSQRVEQITARIGDWSRQRTEGNILGGVSSKVGEMFTPDYEIVARRRDLLAKARDEWGSGNKDKAQELLAEAVSDEQFLSFARKRESDYTAMALGKRDLARSLRSNLSAEESIFMTYLLDNPEWSEKFNTITKQLFPNAPEMSERLIKQKDEIIKEFSSEVKEAREAGIWDAGILFEGYMPHRDPIGGRSAEVLDKIFERMGVPKSQRVNYSDELQKILTGKPTAENARKLLTVDERILNANLPMELDSTLLTARRGIEHARMLTTKTFLNAVGGMSQTVPRDLVRAWNKAGGENWDTSTLMRILDGADDAYKTKKAKQIKDDVVKLAQKLDESGYGVYSPVRKRHTNANLTYDEWLDRGQPLKKGDVITFVDDSGKPQGQHLITKVDKDGKPFAVKIEKSRGRKGKTGETKAKGQEFEINTGQRFDHTLEAPAYIMPKEWINHLHKADKIAKNGDEVAEVLKAYDKIHGWWKGWALFSPGFHFRNMLSATFQDYMAGINPATKEGRQAYNKARKIIMGDKNVKVRIDGKEFTGSEEIEKAIRDKGLVTEQIFTNELPREIEDELFDVFHKFGNKKTGNKEDFLKALDDLEDGDFKKIINEKIYKVNDEGKKVELTRKEFLADLIEDPQKTMPFRNALKKAFGSDGIFLNFNRRIGRKSESFNRYAHFLYFADEDIKHAKKLSPEDAALSVKKYHFDYNELTDWEKKVFKRAMPFYTWMRKNLPLQIELIARQPGRYSAATTKLFEAVENLSEDLEELPVPDYFHEINAIRLPQEAMSFITRFNQGVDELLGGEGEVEEMPMFLDPQLPFQDLNRFNFKDAISSLSPLLRIPIETTLEERGRSLFLDRPIEKFAGEPADTPLIPFTDVRLRGKYQYATEAALPPVGKVSRLFKGVEEGTPLSRIMSEFGVSVKPVDVQRVKRSKVYEKRQRLRDIDRKYKRLKELEMQSQQGQ